LKALSLEPKVTRGGWCAGFCSCWLLQCMIVDDWSEDGRVLVLIEAIDRPRLLNDITRIITEESGSSAANAVCRFPFLKLCVLFCRF